MRKETKGTRIEIRLTFSSWYRKRRFLRRNCARRLRKQLKLTNRKTPVAPFCGTFLSNILTEPDEGVSSGPFVYLLTISSE